MGKYEKVMTIFNELPNIYETIGSTSNNMYSGDEFDDNQEAGPNKKFDSPALNMTKDQKKFIQTLVLARTKELQNENENMKKKLKISKYEKFGLDQILPAFMLSRTSRCRHPANISCSENVLMSFYKTFVTIFSLKMIANNLTYLGKWKKLF